MKVCSIFPKPFYIISVFDKMKYYILPIISKFCYLFLFFGVVNNIQAQDIVLETQYLKFAVNKNGNLTGLSDKRSGKNYFPSGQACALLSLYKDSTYLKPVSASFNRKNNIIALKYSNGSIAEIKIVSVGTYLKLILQSLLPRNGIEAIVWGPYATSIRESIGETICVVHDDQFAIGLQALNINTIEGLPEGNDDAGGGSFIDPLPGQFIPDSLKDQIGKEVEVNVNVTGDMPAYVRMYRGSAAVKKSYGSALQLFSRDRRIPRVVKNGITREKGTNLQYVEPIDVDFQNSAIAFFGCPQTETLNVIEKIELKENLPHPMLNGQWIKRSTIPGEAYLMYEGKDMNKGIAYARQFGFKLIHIGDLFQSWGHFGLKTTRYPEGAPGIRQVTNAAWKDSIALGVHTLTMFTGTNDPYVSPIPSDSLCKSGTTTLTQDAGVDDAVIYIKEPDYFENQFGTHTVKIGKELIGYREISKEEPWRLLDCKRGQFGTQVSAHPANSKVDKLVNNDYQGFFPDIHLQDDFAKRLAAVCNETGLGLMDFDGFGGGSPTGHGAYGAARFIDLWYRSLNQYVLTCGAGTFHYYWHIFSFMNWGEPWYNALRQSQVNYRIENQRYFKRNYIPHMLGWFSMGPDYRVEETEWIQARSAAFDAGYLLRIDESIEKNGFKDSIFEAVKQWQEARRMKAFTKEQLQRLSNPQNEFHLSAAGKDTWSLYPVTLSTGNIHKFRRVQTGEPIATHFRFNNPYQAQPVRLYAIVHGTEGNKSATISNLKIEINNYQVIEISESLKAGDKLLGDETGIYLCDAYWNKIKRIGPDQVGTWASGENLITLSSDFSGSQSPSVTFDFKSVGPAEILHAER